MWLGQICHCIVLNRLVCGLASTKSGDAPPNQQFMGTKTASFMPSLRASRITTVSEWLLAIWWRRWLLLLTAGVGGKFSMAVAQRCCIWQRFIARSHPSGFRFFCVWTVLPLNSCMLIGVPRRDSLASELGTVSKFPFFNHIHAERTQVRADSVEKAYLTGLVSLCYLCWAFV